VLQNAILKDNVLEKFLALMEPESLSQCLQNSEVRVYLEELKSSPKIYFSNISFTNIFSSMPEHSKWPPPLAVLRVPPILSFCILSTSKNLEIIGIGLFEGIVYLKNLRTNYVWAEI
jgi:hypothetical protein